MKFDQKRFDYLSRNRDGAIRAADTLIVSVSSGVLALSVTFLDKSQTLEATWALKNAWVQLVLAIVSVFVSLILERTEWTRLLRQSSVGDSEKSGFGSKLIRCLNIVASLSFLQAMIHLVIFMFFNV